MKIISRTGLFNTAVVFMFLVAVSGPVFSAGAEGRIGIGFGGRPFDRVPEPRLMEPTGETLSFSGRKQVVFRWSPHEGRSASGRYYIFRLYEGYDMVASTLIEKQRTRAYSVNMPAERFEPGKVYTWSVRQHYPAVGKSRRSYHSFRAVK